MSHEVSRTFEIDGRFFNVPSVSNGKSMRPRESIDLFFKKNPGAKGFTTLDKAIGAAKKRSDSFNSRVGPVKKRLR